MRGMTIKFALMLLTIGLGTQASAHVALNYPVGEETFTSGETVTILWTELVAHGTINWDLYFSSDGGINWNAIQLNIDYGTTSYAWTVPEIITYQGVVKVIQDNPGANYEHQCLNFTIVISTAPPTIEDGAQDMGIDCSTAGQEAMIQSWLANNGGASATSSCGALTWSNDYEGLSDGCGATGNAIVSFTVTDECANSSTTTATLTIDDNAAPVVDNAAQDMTAECSGSGTPQEVTAWLNNNGGASASDECGAVVWTNDFHGLDDGCGFTGTTNVIFLVTDECGNTNSTNATLVVEDSSPPDVETEAQDIVIECSTTDQQIDIQTWIATHGGAIASDNCGNMTWANDYTGLSDECGAAGNATVIFTITDECGNASTTQAILTVTDTEPPSMDKLAQDISVECDDLDRGDMIQDWLNNNGGATATDMCGNVIWSNNYTEPSEDCVDQSTEPVTFTATDDCGNSAGTVGNIKNTISTGIDGIPELSNVRIYPNPSIDKIHIEFESDVTASKSLFMYAMGGKLVWKDRGTSNSWQLGVNDYPSGVYLLKVITAEGSLIRKVVVE